MTTPRPVEARRYHRGLGALLAIGGVASLVAAFVLTDDELKLAKNPNFVPNCNISAIVNCTNVMKSDQATVFGFPNPWIGMMAFPIVITIGVLLLAKVEFPEWIWAGFQVGVTLGVVFVTWLQYETIYQISALCPWCMLVWACVIPTFIYVTLRNLRAWIPDSRFVGFVGDWNALILLLWYIVIGAAIYFRLYA